MAIDILAIQPQVISRDLRSKYLLLAGAPKIGKTEFCTMAPDALVLAFEIGTNARPGAMIQKIDTWSTFKLVLRQLEKPEAKAKFSTICVDTVAIALLLLVHVTVLSSALLGNTVAVNLIVFPS